MNLCSNIWKHPRTTATGVLIGVTTVAGVLSQQGVSLGHVGNGNVVTLASALAAALLRLVARDPGGNNADGPGDEAVGQKKSSGAQSTSGAILKSLMLVALLLQLSLTQRCTTKNVAQEIVNWAPVMQSAVAAVDATSTILDPADAAIFATATTGFDAASNLLATQARAYLANPNSGTLAQLQTQVVAFQQQVNAALLSAARIVNPQGQQRALVAIQAVATAVIAILALVQSISSKEAVASMAAQSTVKLAMVEPLIDSGAAARMVAAHYSETQSAATVQVRSARAALMQAGF